MLQSFANMKMCVILPRFLFISLSLQGLSRFEVLQELDISENDVVFLPPSVGQLLNLKELNISKNGETPFL